eukprot:SAG11_NODE_3417_length_2461_cov_3.698561_2_plen_97_part_00
MLAKGWIEPSTLDYSRLSFAAESPALHPRISAAERALVANAGRAPPPSAAAKAAVAVPPLLGEMLRAPALWGQIVCDFGMNWFFYGPICSAYTRSE